MTGAPERATEAAACFFREEEQNVNELRGYIRLIIFMICTTTATAILNKDPAIEKAVNAEIKRLQKELQETKSIFDDLEVE